MSKKNTMATQYLPKILELIQNINDSVHRKPTSIIAHGAFWILIMFTFPFAAMILMIVTVLRLLLYFAGFEKEVDTSENDLAVVITGCDSGFGRAAALDCHAKGYHVFAGCLKEESVTFFKENCRERMTPILLDVCKQEHAEALVKCLSKWVEEGEGSKDGKQRYLHALINNAGRGSPGLVHWMNLDDYRADMEVNLFGQIRLVKSLLNIFMNQRYSHARIVNMVSMAGLAPSVCCSAYTVSKYASEAFSQCLRLELRNFKIHVVTMNPSFHETPITATAEESLMRKWDGLPAETKAMYGEEFLKSSLLEPLKHLPKITWKASNVERDMMTAIDLMHPPARIVTGIDAKFYHLLVRMLPAWATDLFFPRFFHPPALVKDRESVGKKSPMTKEKTT